MLTASDKINHEFLAKHIGFKHLDSARDKKKNYRLAWCDKFYVIIVKLALTWFAWKMWLGQGITKFFVLISFAASGSN